MKCIKCKNKITPPERAKLGYDTCLQCGDSRKQFTVGIAYNKGAYQLITKKMIPFIGKK